ncbi:MAG TPA: prolyl oligopeptidase family serine peptidase [Vicinamibacterales bacterium]|nr:prolyl oligopeptidase family serine peptidase [Vicinamibacterales bacterium]
MKYPASRKLPLIETIHGVPVADPYRWLEDPDSPETRAWIDAQNTLTRSALDGPARETLVRRLTDLYDFPQTLSLQRRGGRYFFTHNPGLLNQPILYVLDAASENPRVLLDPNALSTDGTTALTAAFPSPDGARLAYALSEAGSDRQEIRVRVVPDVDDPDLPDRLRWVKFASLAWTRDGTGFYYLRFPAPGAVAHEDEQYYGRIFFHRLGDPQASDVLVFERPDEKEVVPLVDVDASGRWTVITAQRGASDDSEIYIVDRSTPGPPRPVFTGFADAYHFIDEAAGRLFFRTTQGAPLGRIVSIDPERPEIGIQEVVGESADRLSAASMARGSLVAVYLHNANDRLRRFDLARGRTGAVREPPLPGIGSIVMLDAQPDDDEVRIVYTSFTQPPAAYVLDTTAFRTFGRGGSRTAPTYDGYVTRQVWYRSKDGTRVSMFLVHRADLATDGDRPILLSGYGGFNINRTPAFDPGNVPFLDRGGLFALANVRGGGEYGEAWHRAGMLDRKQNVFDDFIGAAEFLIADGYTHPNRIAIEGGSNGGLLVATVMIQRPDLFGAVVCRVPVADMLRYHLFTVGRFWIPEYGSAEDPTQFAYLLKYSPYHNVREGVRYPPALIMTADTDDRVSPGMAKKLAARLQADGDGGPFLIRIETKAGHGAGKPVAKVIEEDADILSFLTQTVLRTDP